MEDSAGNFSTYLSIAAAVITGLSTLAGVALANRAAEKKILLQLDREEEKAHKDLIRSRLEELYQLIDSWGNYLVTHYLTYRRVMEGVISYNEALDIELGRDQDTQAIRLFMLAELYFPEFRDLLDQIKACRDEASRIQHDFKEEYRDTGCESAKHADKLSVTLMAFTEKVEQYKQGLSRRVHEV